MDLIQNAEGFTKRETSGAYSDNFIIRDHLGDTRVVFQDKNNDGTIDIATELIQVNAYYPFGLNHGANSNGAGGAYKYQYNGKEWNDDFGLNWNHNDWRFYDPAVGRFWTVDRVSEREDQVAYTDYHFGFDDPIKNNDPTGECPWCVAALAGAASGAAFEDGSQVVGNLSEGKGWNSFKDVDGGTILKAGAVGAALGGIGGKAVQVLNKIVNAGEVLNAVVKNYERTSTTQPVVKSNPKVQTTEQQTASLVTQNGGKSRITLRSPSVQKEVDLKGDPHFDKPTDQYIQTPHTHSSELNPRAPNQPQYNTSQSQQTTTATSQQEIRAARKYLEKQN